MAKTNNKLLSEAFSTLFYSWGSDTPNEAIWAANNFLEYLEQKNGISFGMTFQEVDQEQVNANGIPNNEELLEKIENLNI